MRLDHLLFHFRALTGAGVAAVPLQGWRPRGPGPGRPELRTAARDARAFRCVPGDGCKSMFFSSVATYRMTRRDRAIAAHSRPSQASTCSCFYVFPGGNSGEATPVPIPNTEVKLSRADGTAGATLWESRTLPGFVQKARDSPRGPSPFSGRACAPARQRACAPPVSAVESSTRPASDLSRWRGLWAGCAVRRSGGAVSRPP